MATKITRDVLESYLHCKFKGYLKLTGQQGTKCDFEAMLKELRDEVRKKAIETIIARHPGDQIAKNIRLTTAGLKQGLQYIFDGTLEDDTLALHFDGLKRVEGESKLGAFHYQPVLIVAREKIAAEHKLLLGIQSLVLDRLQGQQPVTGLIIRGRDGEQSRVKLPLARAEAIFDEIRNLEAAPPRMVLNEHCQVCEFQARCYAQARKDDDLSLLRGLGEKEIKNYHRRGIFTLTQLSCDFRPRRGKTRRAKPRRYPALQAMAIREKKVMVLGSPQMPDSPVRVYLDLEGDPDRDFVYLLGMIVEENGREKQHSFWIDRKEDEKWLLCQFSEVLEHYPDFCILHYGVDRGLKEGQFRALGRGHGELPGEADGA
jgi:predicted RecB family nuclease